MPTSLGPLTPPRLPGISSQDNLACQSVRSKNMSTARAEALSVDTANDAVCVMSPGIVTNPRQKLPGALVISLDFELHWGVRDIAPLDSGERARLLLARRLIPRMLDLFDEFSISATWATVGLLFAHSKEEAEAFMPAKRPKYRECRLDPYSEKLGSGEADDPDRK